MTILFIFCILTIILNINQIKGFYGMLGNSPYNKMFSNKTATTDYGTDKIYKYIKFDARNQISMQGYNGKANKNNS